MAILSILCLCGGRHFVPNSIKIEDDKRKKKKGKVKTLKKPSKSKGKDAVKHQ